MVQTHRPVVTRRRLLLLKWLIVLAPSVTVTLGHTVLRPPSTNSHTLLSSLLITFTALVLAYVFVEILFNVVRRLEVDAMAREQDVLTMNAVMQERERLSRELHDGVAQLVADVLLRLDTIKELVQSGRSEAAEAEIERLHGVADEIYADIGESIAGLRTNLAERGLVRALQDYVDRFEERYQIPTSLRTDQAADELSPLEALQVFRLVQEALTNVRKHAEARQASVTLQSDRRERMRVEIVDDGRGFLPGLQRSGRGRPLGLTSMRERVEALGGTLEVSSHPGSGTRVTATIPVPPTKGEHGHATIATVTR